jgi:ABC-type xylose transport system permease subunit
MKIIREILGRNLRQFGMLFALVALVIFFQVRTGGLVLTPVNMMNLLNGNAYILVLAVGMVLVTSIFVVMKIVSMLIICSETVVRRLFFCPI